MPVVAIPALMRNLTNGEDSVTIPGATIREIIDNLETRYPPEQKRNFAMVTVSIPASVFISTVLSRESACMHALTLMPNSISFLLSAVDIRILLTVLQRTKEANAKSRNTKN